MNKVAMTFWEWLTLFMQALALGFVGGMAPVYEVRYPDTRSCSRSI